jgi:2-oxoglutarate dehydrogenase E2 component (dihydrolipoamide succinyltransferase)
MRNAMKFRMCVALLLISASAFPAVAQNRFMDQAREAADRRAEHKAIREAENPEPVKKTAAAPAEAAPAPAEPAAPAPAPTEAASATPVPAPAPAR